MMRFERCLRAAVLRIARELGAENVTLRQESRRAWSIIGRGQMLDLALDPLQTYVVKRHLRGSATTRHKAHRDCVLLEKSLHHLIVEQLLE